MATSSLDDLLSWQLTRAAARAHRAVAEGLAAVGATGYEFRVLVALELGAPRTQTEVGMLARLDRREVSTTVRSLEERGLLRRATDPGDERAMLVSLTRAGALRVAELADVMDRIQAELAGALTNAQARQLAVLLTKVAPPV